MRKIKIKNDKITIIKWEETILKLEIKRIIHYIFVNSVYSRLSDILQK